jgi:hypothetical protein
MIPLAPRLPRLSPAGCAPAPSAGFTLVEVAAAAAVLVVSILAGTSLVGLASGQVTATARVTAAGDAALEVLATLDGLPYGSAAGLPSVVGQVFPHAQTARNIPEAFYVTSATESWPGGCFVHRRPVDGTAVFLVARFLRRGPGGEWEPLADADLQGRDFTSDAPPAVRVDIRAADRGAYLGGRVYVARASAGEPAP